MSRTLKELTKGTVIYVNELIDGQTVPKPYSVMRVLSNGNVEIERNKSPYNYQINSTNTSVYENSKMDTHLNDASEGFKARFSEALQSRLQLNSIPVFVYGDTEASYISRSIYIYSRGDYFLSAPTALEPNDCTPALVRMDQAKTLTANTARIVYDESDTAVYCWLRSPYGANYVYGINSGGGESSNHASNSCGFRPVLCLDGDTIVSDEGSETIMLLPEEKTYNEIDFEVTMGSREEKPSQAVVNFNATNLYDIECQLCVNLGSENEVWTAVENGVKIDVPDCVKTTDEYIIGFKFYGKATELASVDEPEVYVY